ncbi:MAG: methyl-accepting chemotaxis protein [Candidatus Omnitrophica bacterium]|nr:methyl-accepting chemotaxis protein [Candidatus Omnitrophota bacterium]
MIANNKTRFKRKQLFVSAKFQLKYVGLILLLMFITAIVCSYVVYYSSMILLAEKLANVYPQGRLIAIIKTVNFRVLLSIVLLMPFVAYIGIYLSHKIAGPIYRMERFLEDMAGGNLTSRLSLRKGDELGSIADKINLLSDSMKQTIGRQKASLTKVLIELENLKKLADSKPADISQFDNNIDRLQKEIKDLAHELDWYKV